MPKPYLLGIDIGTQGSKGLVATIDGAVIGQHYVEHGVSRPRPDWAEQDAEQIWWSDFKEICRTLLADSRIPADQIAAIACSGLMPDMLPIDRHGRPLRPAIIYCDGRTSKEVTWIRQNLPNDGRGTPLSWRVHSDTVGPMLLWYRKHEPDLWAQTHKVLDASGYLVFKLTGRYTVGGCNAMGFAPLWDGESNSWSAQACSRLEIPLELLPEYFESTEIVGTVTQAAAKETGLAAGTPVTAGAPDNVAGSISAGVVGPGDAGLEYATVFVLRVVSDHPPDAGMVNFSRYLGNSYCGVGGLTTAGALTRWFRNNFGQLERRAADELQVNAYQLLALQGETIPPGSDGLIVLPYFGCNQGPPTDPRSRGLILGLTVAHSRAHIYRALLEGTAYQLAQLLGWLNDMAVKPDIVTSVGGGTNNALWLQIVSDVTGMEQRVPQRQLAAPLGDAYLAAMATGQVKDFTVLKERWVKTGRVIEPDPANHARYEEYLRIYLDLYEANKQFMHELADLGCA